MRERLLGWLERARSLLTDPEHIILNADTALPCQRWELIEQGPRWTLCFTHTGTARHPGETLETLYLPNGTTLWGGRVEGTVTTSRSQDLVITGVGTTYETSP